MFKKKDSTSASTPAKAPVVPDTTASDKSGPAASKFKRRYLGEILINAGLIDQATLDKALALGKGKSVKLGRLLVQLGAVDDVQIARALSDQLAIPFVNLESLEIPGDVIDLVSEELAKNYTLIPVSATSGSINVVPGRCTFSLDMPRSLAFGSNSTNLGALFRLAFAAPTPIGLSLLVKLSR